MRLVKGGCSLPYRGCKAGRVDRQVGAAGAAVRRSSLRRPTERVLDVHGAAEHNLRDVDVTFGPGLTAVVGVSGSGKSSLAFDVVYAEARRRFVETLALGASRARVPAAQVRRIDGLGPAVAVAQNVLNSNPASTVATSTGMHPFLRILYSRFAEVGCPRCGVQVRATSGEERLAIALDLLATRDSLDVDVAVVRGLAGSHARLLAGLRGQFAKITVDGRPWTRPKSGPVPRLDPTTRHEVVVRVATLRAGMAAAEVRATLERADALGRPEVRLGGTPVLRAPVCPSCGSWVRPLEPSAFHDGTDTSSHRIAGVTFDELLARSVTEVLGFVEQLPVGRRAARLQDELLRRLRPLDTLGLGHLALDRSMPTLSRGEAQRTRLAVVLGGRLEDLLHVLDEPTIGLHHTDLKRLLDAIASLPGPVVMVEHDRSAIANADDVVEIGPAGGRGGGELVFQGTPAALWRADTASGHGFSTIRRGRPARRLPSDERIRISGASLRNLRDVDCEIPLGALTVITGPSGAGKTTLARDVLLESIRDKAPIGCSTFDAPVVRAIAVDQKPLGNNPRSNPATYTKVFDRIRDVFAAETGQSASEFTFNRAEGACPECEGMGSVAISLSHLAPIWVPCEACDGSRFRPEVLEATWRGRSIADVLEMSVDDASALFVEHRSVTRILQTLQEVGLGYVTLGQPSPSLSGGEAQRVRLTREVTRAKTGDLVLLDEPTTGLHPSDLDRLLTVLDRLTANGCTVVVVEHQADVIASADWRIDLGPGGGPDGGRLQHSGPPGSEKQPRVTPRAKPRPGGRSSDAIRVRGARAHNLQGVDVDFGKGRFTVVTGVSGSGKSSLVHDVVAAEASRRLLECLSVYERQSVREGPEAPVDSLTGLGPTTIIDAAGTLSAWWSSDGRESVRATVGRASDLDRLIAIVLARSGVRTCLACGSHDVRRTSPAAEATWTCDDCATRAVPIEPRHLMGSPVAICPTCLGQGVTRQFHFDRWVVQPDAPIPGCFRGSGGGPSAMTSASMALLGYFCKDGTGGNASLRAFADRQGFDLATTPWSGLTEEARQAFMFGDPSPTNEFSRVAWIGMNHWAQYDLGGADTQAFTCSECGGRRLRAAYLAIRLDGRDRHDLYAASLAELADVLESIGEPADEHAADARTVALHRLGFLRSVGLGYLQMNRATWTLSAGEAQRIKLASVLGGGLVGMTVLLDEPSRGLHPVRSGSARPHPGRAARRRKHRDRGRARRHPHSCRRRRRRDRSRSRTSRRPAHRPCQRRVGHPGSAGRTHDDRSPRPPRADTVDACQGSAGEQPARPRRAPPAWRAGRRMRGVRVGKVLARRRHHRAGAGATEDQHPWPGRDPRRARRPRRHLRRAHANGGRRSVPGRDHVAWHVPRAHQRSPKVVRRERGGPRAGHHDQGPHLRLRRLQRQRRVAGGHVVPADGDPDLRRVRRLRLPTRDRHSHRARPNSRRHRSPHDRRTRRRVGRRTRPCIGWAAPRSRWASVT